MTVFHCAGCGAPFTPPPVRLPEVPEPPPYRPEAGSRRSPATIPPGCFAIETEPWGAPYVPYPDDADGPVKRRAGSRSDGRGTLRSAGPRGNIVLNPADAPGVVVLPATSVGCCAGPVGGMGLNRACPCGLPVATLAADCSTVNELHLDAKSVRIGPGETQP